MRTSVAVMIVILAGVAPCNGQDAPIVAAQPVATSREMLHKYIGATFGLDGALHATFFSALSHWQDSPPEWGSGTTGYAKRWTSKYAQSAIGNTAKYGVASIFHHDPSFAICQCTGFGRRLRHAVVSPFVARTRDGRQVFSAASLAGFITGHVVSASTWYPAEHGARDGLQDAGVSLMSTIGVDIFKEFRPRRPR